MKSSIALKLEQLARRLDELTRLLSSEDVVRDMDGYRKLTREHAEITPLVALYQSFKQAEADAHTAQGMLVDAQMKSFAETELREARERMAAIEIELQKLLLPKDPNDERNTFLEIRAGTGGDESGLFAGDLLRMYMRFAERNRWQVELISESPSEIGGFKEVIAKIIGQGVFSKLKFESGGHRVQRVPATETQGRIHTSACTVAVMPEVEQIDDVLQTRVRAPFVREVTLRAAVFQPHALRIADPRRGEGVPHQHHLPASPQQLPELIAGERREREQRQDERDNSHARHSPA